MRRTAKAKRETSSRLDNNPKRGEKERGAGKKKKVTVGDWKIVAGLRMRVMG